MRQIIDWLWAVALTVFYLVKVICEGLYELVKGEKK